VPFPTGRLLPNPRRNSSRLSATLSYRWVDREKSSAPQARRSPASQLTCRYSVACLRRAGFSPFRSTSCNIAFSKVRSATKLFNRRFSSSNGLELETFVEADRLQYGTDPEPFSFRRWSRAYVHIRRRIFMVREARKLRETIAPVSAPADRAPPASSADQTSGDLAAFLDEPAFARPPDGYEVTRALLSATRDECRRIGARFLVLLIPPRELVTEAPNPTSEMAVYSARSYRAIRDVCRLEKLPYLDTLGELAFRHRDGEALFFARDPHMTPQGHVALAEMVARKISEDKLMPDPVGPKE